MNAHETPEGKALLAIVWVIQYMPEAERINAVLQVVDAYRARVAQLAAIARAQAEGRYTGRQPTARVQAARVRVMKDAGAGATQIAKALGIGRASVYRCLAMTEERPL